MESVSFQEAHVQIMTQGPDAEVVTVFSDESADNANSALQSANEQTKQIQGWLRMLLFELLQFLAQVWQTAFECLTSQICIASPKDS